MTTRSPSRLVTALLVTLVTLLLLPWLMVVSALPASAHPLGQFTTNTSVAFIPSPESVDVVMIIDLAEIPTQQAREDIAAAGDEQAWAADECALALDGHSVSVDGSAVDLAATGVGVAFLEGDAGLQTLRIRCDAAVEGPIASTGGRLAYQDGYRLDRQGWREVLAAGDGVAVTADVPTESVTGQLREYPDVDVSDVRQAEIVWMPGEGDPAAVTTLRSADIEVQAPPSTASGIEGLIERFLELVSRQQLTPLFVLGTFALAIVLGTAHAVAPGHGKTVIAAYLLGEGGQARQALGLGATVAVTHTIGVLILGVVVQTSTTLAPQRLYPTLGAIGGALFTLVGVTLLRRALKGGGHGHSHDDHGHGHSHAAHGDHEHGDHGHGDHEHGGHGHGDHEPRGSGWRMLILPGLAGGMVPSPSALVVLLAGVALGRTWYGVLLVIAYGIGMALALVGAGYLLHRVRDQAMAKLESRTWARISGALPVATSSLIIVGGLVIIGRSLLLA